MMAPIHEPPAVAVEIVLMIYLGIAVGLMARCLYPIFLSRAKDWKEREIQRIERDIERVEREIRLLRRPRPRGQRSPPKA